ncbi:peptidase S41 [Bacteroidia bacterium]|nr:peptidase S41 [Bacteroidia bacterium]
MYRNSRLGILLPTLLALAMSAGILIGIYAVRPSGGASGDVVPKKLRATLSLIEKAYVDSVDMDSVAERLIPQLVEELDPHSMYIPARELQSVNESLDGEFDGIGVMFNMITDTVVVLNVISGGPSDRAGVVNGDRIIFIDDSLVAGRHIDQNNIVKRLRGKRGTNVSLRIERGAVRDLVPITVTRGVVTVKSIDAALMITPRIGYVKLLTFSKNSYSEMVKAIDKLREEGMRQLIFDLRGNSGGFLDQAISIANELLPGRNLIVYTVDRHKKRTMEYSNGRGKLTDIPLVILIDEGSASSSEILAGAIQDNDRGVIIGRRSFGKGLVQQQFPYSDGSALRLTIARYYTPTGRSIQKPYDKGNEQYGNDILNRYKHNEFFSADSIRFADSLRFVTPGGKVVYGGGGIMPDIFVPMDTSAITKYYLEVAGRNILYRYTLEYSDRHRRQLNAIRSVDQLRGFIYSDRGLLEEFVSYAARGGVKPVPEQIKASTGLILSQIRSLVARNSPLEDTGYWAIAFADDQVILRAIEELDK